MSKDNSPERDYRVVVACRLHGAPRLYGTTVTVTERQAAFGLHYEIATDLASGDGYETDKAVAFDESDGPAWLFENVFGRPGRTQDNT